MSISPRVMLEFGLTTSLIFCFLGAMAVLLGHSALTNVLWLGTRLGDVLTALGVIALASPIPTLFVTSLLTLRQLERTGRFPRLGGANALGENAAALNAGSFDERTPRLVPLPPPSVTEHTTLRLALSEVAFDEYDLPTTRPN